MKKLLATFFAFVLCFGTCVALAACDLGGSSVAIEEIHIVAPESTEITAGETFTLEYTVVPESAAEKVKVNWEIDNEQRLSYKKGEFTALTCGTVKVTASVKGNEATDEIELKVTAPDGFKEYSGTGYQLVHPRSWTTSTVMGIRTWTAKNGTTNMNISTEDLNESYFTAPASSFQAVIEGTYGLMGADVKFAEPVTLKKDTYLGMARVRVEYNYSITMLGETLSFRQTQMIINSSDTSYLLTVTFLVEDFDEAAETLQETIFSQFVVS